MMRLLSALLLFQLLPTLTVCFTPAARDSAAAVLANGMIWVFGGCVSNGTQYASSNSLYSLDVSQPWSSSSPPWTDHSSDLTSTSLVYTRCQSTLELEADNVTLMVFGGQAVNTDEILTDKSPAVSYNTNTHMWSSVTVSDTSIMIVHALSAVRNGQGEIFYFGGQNDQYTGASTNTTTLNSNVYTFSNGVWNVLTTNEPITRDLGSATLVGTKVYLIGGIWFDKNYTSMDAINVFDTVTNIWLTASTTGSTPVSRVAHTAVLSMDGTSIIIFGGQDSTANYLNDIWILNVNTFQWTSPNVTGSPPAGGLYGANAVLLGSQMLIMFGSNLAGYSNAVYILDTSTWNWTTSFTNPADKALPNSAGNTSIITASTGYSSAATAAAAYSSVTPSGLLAPIGGIGGAVGIAAGVLAAIALPLVFFILYRGRKENHRKLNSDFSRILKEDIPELPVLARTRSIPELPVRPSKSLYKPDSNDPTPIYPELKPNEVSESDRQRMWRA